MHALTLQGPILAFIYAVKEMLEEGQATLTALPVNVAFVFEGEEENGQFAVMPTLPLLVCDVMLQCSGVWLLSFIKHHMDAFSGIFGLPYLSVTSLACESNWAMLIKHMRCCRECGVQGRSFWQPALV